MARLLLVFFIGLLLAGCNSNLPKIPINVVPHDTAYLTNCRLLGDVTLPLVSTFKYPPGNQSDKFKSSLASEALKEFPEADHVSWSGLDIVGAYPFQKYKASGTVLRCYQ